MRIEFNRRNFPVSPGLHGEIMVDVIDSALAPRSANEPRATLSQMWEYLDAYGLALARAHVYWRPNKTIGGKGRPDPKWLAIDSVAWEPRHEDDERCEDCPSPPLHNRASAVH